MTALYAPQPKSRSPANTSPRVLNDVPGTTLSDRMMSELKRQLRQICGLAVEKVSLLGDSRYKSQAVVTNRHRMCGIAALLGGLPPEQIEASLLAMLEAQVHRGPDDVGSTLISSGTQPLAWEIAVSPFRMSLPLAINRCATRIRAMSSFITAKFTTRPNSKDLWRGLDTASVGIAIPKSCSEPMSIGASNALTACEECSHLRCGICEGRD